MPDKLMTLLGYCNKGWNIFPLLEKEKTPATASGFKDATSNFGKVIVWHNSNPNLNWGIATGKVVIIDIDPKNGATTESIKALELPRTLTVVTGSGGLHLYYKNSGIDIRNSASKLEKGVDVRGMGGYAVLPPSIHPNGTEYRWSNPDAEIVEFPLHLKTELNNISYLIPRFVQPEHIENGLRNETLFKLSCSLRTKGLLNESILAAVLIENKRRCSPPLEDEEVERIVNSSLRYSVE